MVLPRNSCGIFLGRVEGWTMLGVEPHLGQEEYLTAEGVRSALWKLLPSKFPLHRHRLHCLTCLRQGGDQ